jgi:hypothetical protein
MSLLDIMQLNSVLAAIAATNVSAVAGFKVIAYGDWNCKGSRSTINVWDNTCRSTGVADTWSIWILNYGVKRKRGRSYIDKSECMGPLDLRKYWIDGGDGAFKTGTCVNFSEAVKVMSSSKFE